MSGKRGVPMWNVHTFPLPTPKPGLDRVHVQQSPLRAPVLTLSHYIIISYQNQTKITNPVKWTKGLTSQ